MANDPIPITPPRRRLRTGDSQFFCPICRKPVKLETAKTDGDGQAIHDACYLKQICGLIPPDLKKPPASQY